MFNLVNQSCYWISTNSRGRQSTLYYSLLTHSCHGVSLGIHTNPPVPALIPENQPWKYSRALLSLRPQQLSAFRKDPVVVITRAFRTAQVWRSNYTSHVTQLTAWQSSKQVLTCVAHDTHVKQSKQQLNLLTSSKASPGISSGI